MRVQYGDMVGQAATCDVYLGGSRCQPLAASTQNRLSSAGLSLWSAAVAALNLTCVLPHLPLPGTRSCLSACHSLW